jgi:hypothetical protein
LPGLQQQLHDWNVEPAAELEADLFQDAVHGEARGFMQPPDPSPPAFLYIERIRGRSAALAGLTRIP